MYSIFIVDDNPLTVESLEKGIEWDEMGLEITGLFYNGSQALEAMLENEPDIILTDIRMPKMDGLELVKQIKERNIKSKVIILSAYDEFTYAQKAIRLGVEGYLLKPLDEEQLESMIKEIIEVIKKEEVIQSRVKMVDLAEENVSTVHMRTLDKIIKEKDKQKIQKLLEKLGLEIHGNTYFTIVLQLFNKENKIKENQMIILDTIKEVIKEFKGSVIFYTNSNSLLCILKDEKKILDAIYIRSIIKHIKEKVEVLGYDAVFTIGEFLKGTENIKQNILNIIDLNKYYFYKPRRIRYVDQLNLDINFIEDYQISTKEKIVEKIMLGNSFEEIDELKNIFKLLNKNKDAKPKDVCREIFSIFEILKKEIDKNNLDLERVINIKLSDIEVNRSIDELELYVKNLVNNLNEKIKDNNDIKYIIRRAKTYAKEHLVENIVLEDMVGSFGISKNYFCNCFKEETGETFWDYLTRKRVEKAKELLNTDMKTYEIAIQVGYETPSYLSKIFKRYTNLTPSQYRKKIKMK